jgi:hypothetical protein
MSDAVNSGQEVLVVLDPDFGDRLQQVAQGQAIWITMSPANAPMVHALWGAALTPNHLAGITGFQYHEGIAAEDSLLDQLDAIDLHHGPYSTKTSYTVLKVIGAQPTPPVQAALSALGFSTFEKSRDGFTATRSEPEARRLRD